MAMVVRALEADARFESRVLVTAQHREMLDQVLDLFGIVLSGDTLPEMKPHPAPLLHAAAHFGVPPADSLLVGDSVTDVQAARAAGFGIICMSYGYNHGRDIREAKPDAVLDSLAALPVLLAAAPLND